MKPGWAERHPDLAGIDPTAGSAAAQPPQIASVPLAQLRPPQIASAPPAQPQQPQIASIAFTRRQVNDAFAYVRHVQAEFRDYPAKFAEFLEVLDGFRNGRIGRMEVLIQLETLFDGYPELLQAFRNNFFPINLP